MKLKKLLHLFIFSFLFSLNAQTVLDEANLTEKEKLKEIYRENENLISENKWDKLMILNTIALNKYPNDTLLNITQGFAFLANDSDDKALASFKKILTHTDTVAKYLAVAIMYLETDNKVILPALKFIDKISPNNFYLACSRAEFVIKIDLDTLKGINKLEELITKADDYEQKLYINTIYSENLIRINDPRALDFSKNLVKEYPKTKAFVSDYAYLFKRASNYSLAMDNYNKYFALGGDNFYTIKDAMYCLKKLNNIEELEKMAAKYYPIFNDDRLILENKVPSYFTKPKITPNSTFVFNVSTSYDFIVSNINNTDSFRQFNYEMTNEENYKNTITIEKNALINANEYVNYFNGEPLNLTNASTVWFSDKNFNDILTTGKTNISISNGIENDKYTLVENTEDVKDYNAFENKILTPEGEKYVETLHIINQDKTNHFWILNDKENPIIVKMDVGFIIELKEIK